jgi:N-acylneuraminate cytidylyltransferase
VNKIFIPIKEHSQRVPQKNFRDFGGKPLYQHVISKYFTCGAEFELWVDTDSEEIWNWVNNECPDNFYSYMRPESLRGDDVSVNLLISNFIKNHCGNGDAVAQIHITSPFLEPSDLLPFSLDKYDSITSANVIQSRIWREEKYGYCPVNHNPMKMEKTQDLPVLYEENSAFYIFKVDSFKRTGKRIGEKNCFWSLNFPKNLDIDTEEDWDICKKVLEIYK